MGYAYHTKRPLRVGNLEFQGRVLLPTESLSASTALQSLSTEGASFLTLASSGAGRDFRLPAPVAGMVKVIAVNRATTSATDLRILCNTTAHTFFGTTFNQAALADSTTPGTRVRTLMLVGVSTNQWAAIGQGTTSYWAFSASTGSTGQ